MEEYIFDELDNKIKQYSIDTGMAPDAIEMDLYTYLEFKRELGYDENDIKEIKTWSGFDIIVNIFNEERTLRCLQTENHR